MYSHVGSIALIVSPLKALMKDQVSPLVATLMVIWFSPHMVLLLPHKVTQQLFYSAQLLLSYHTRTQPYLSHSSISLASMCSLCMCTYTWLCVITQKLNLIRGDAWLDPLPSPDCIVFADSLPSRSFSSAANAFFLAWYFMTASKHFLHT